MRSRLKEITDVPDVASHPALLEKLKAAMPCSLKILQSSHPLHRYTCVVHALNLVEDPEYVGIARCGRDTIYAGPEFVHFLLERECLTEIGASDASQSDFIFYFNGDAVKHAGQVAGPERIVSKWGVGQLIEHELFHVPIQYGTSVRYFRQIDKDLVLDHFVEFAKSKGMQFRE